ncbi:MAG: hypothetical protein WB676_28340 [Bryobacteraceae bacterium]
MRRVLVACHRQRRQHPRTGGLYWQLMLSLGLAAVPALNAVVNNEDLNKIERINSGKNKTLCFAKRDERGWRVADA